MLLKQSARLDAILEELEKSRLKFLHLLDEVSKKDWNLRLSGEGWTIKQEMVHIVQVLNVIPSGIRRASSGRVRSFLAFVPAGIRSWLNGHVVIPVMAINATRASLADNYNKAHTTLVDLLVTLPEEAWCKGIPYPKKYRTVEQMAHRPAEHFEEHVDHLRKMLGN